MVSRSRSGCWPSPLGPMRKGRRTTLSNTRPLVAFDHCLEPETGVVVGFVEVLADDVEVLVLQCVDQLVDENRLEERRHPVAPDEQLIGFGVVPPEDALTGRLLAGGGEVDVLVDQAQGFEDHLSGADLLGFGLGLRVVAGVGDVLLELLFAQEAHLDILVRGKAVDQADPQASGFGDVLLLLRKLGVVSPGRVDRRRGKERVEPCQALAFVLVR